MGRVAGAGRMGSVAGVSSPVVPVVQVVQLRMAAVILAVDRVVSAALAQRGDVVRAVSAKVAEGSGRAESGAGAGAAAWVRAAAVFSSIRWWRSTGKKNPCDPSSWPCRL